MQLSVSDGVFVWCVDEYVVEEFVLVTRDQRASQRACIGVVLVAFGQSQREALIGSRKTILKALEHHRRKIDIPQVSSQVGPTTGGVNRRVRSRSDVIDVLIDAEEDGPEGLADTQLWSPSHMVERNVEGTVGQVVFGFRRRPAIDG